MILESSPAQIEILSHTQYALWLCYALAADQILRRKSTSRRHEQRAMSGVRYAPFGTFREHRHHASAAHTHLNPPVPPVAGWHKLLSPFASPTPTNRSRSSPGAN
eukprot:8691987-Pyramimonas_sp.AAC.1